jgi:hypothetical protein
VIRWLWAGGSDGLPVYGTEAQGYLPELRGYPLTPMGHNLRSFISTGALVVCRYRSRYMYVCIHVNRGRCTHPSVDGVCISVYPR